jgi:hypothetical protein
MGRSERIQQGTVVGKEDVLPRLSEGRSHHACTAELLTCAAASGRAEEQWGQRQTPDRPAGTWAQLLLFAIAQLPASQPGGRM